jgi:hypothetical protein
MLWECAVAGDTKVETPEGALAIRSVAGKAIAVFTREPGGRVRFRMMQNVRRLATEQPVLRIVLETGQSFRVAPMQVLFRKGMVECRAETLRVGDALEPAFHYPEGYAFRDDACDDGTVSTRSLRVARIEAGGNADLYGLAVKQTGCFFLSAGVLCKAESAPPGP